MKLPKLLCIANNAVRVKVIADRPVLEQIISDQLIMDQTMLVIEDIKAPWIDRYGIMHLNQQNLDEVMTYIGDAVGDITMGVSVDVAMGNLIAILTGQSINVGG